MAHRYQPSAHSDPLETHPRDVADGLVHCLGIHLACRPVPPGRRCRTRWRHYISKTPFSVLFTVRADNKDYLLPSVNAEELKEATDLTPRIAYELQARAAK